MKKYKMQICVAAAVLLFAAAVFCGFQVYHHYAQVDEQTEAAKASAKAAQKAAQAAKATARASYIPLITTGGV